MILLTECNVSMSKVKMVINTVCKNLLGKLPERLPSLGTLDRILSEAKFVAQNQIYKCMEEGGDPTTLTGNTLHNDATTKFHHHYQGFQVTLLNGKQMTIGLREVGAADTDTLMDAFTSTVEEITAAVSDSTAEKQTKIAELISSLKNTMGDQGPTNPQFNSQVQTLRETLLPKVVENWDTLSEENQKEIANMGNFFCKMHLLANFATEADKVLKINEAVVVAEGKNPYAFGTESGGARLVRNAAKAFTSHGSDKSGMTSDWETYLEQQGKTNHMVTFRGNRFNILFYDAWATYFHRHDLYKFISTIPDPNNLIRAVNFDIQQKVYLAQLRALGLIDKLITGPFWRLVENTESILELNDPLNEMLQQMKRWAEDATPLFAGEVPFQGAIVHDDDIYEELMKETDDADFDTYTHAALEMVLSAMILILERQAKDQLEGGKFFAPSEQMKASSRNVPTTNTVSERDFAILDVLTRIKPAATSHAYETYIMWLNNKPSQWLETLDNEEKKHFLNMARHKYPEIRQQYIQRKDKLKAHHLKSLRAKQSRQEHKEEKGRLEKVAATEGIIPYGGVWTQEEVDTRVMGLPVEERKGALIAQIQYQKKVLNAKGSPGLFYKSSQGVAFTVDQLKTNLTKILDLNKITTENVKAAKSLHYHTSEKVSSNVQQSKLELRNKVAMQRTPNYC